VCLPFDAFTVGVLRALNVALTQLHPNTWASMQAFRVVCLAFGVRPLTSCFFAFLCLPSCRVGRLAFFVLEYMALNESGGELFKKDFCKLLTLE